MASKPGASPEEIVVLPKVEVQGQFDATGWWYGHQGPTEFISHISEKRSHSIAQDFIIFQRFVRAYYSEAAPDENSLLTVVLCRTTGEYQSFVGNSKPEREAMAHSERYRIVDAADADQTALQREIRQNWLQAGYRAHRSSKTPLWLEMAMIEILTAIEVTGQTKVAVGFPPFNPHSEGFKIIPQLGSSIALPLRSMQFALKPNETIPLSRLFSLSREDRLGGKAHFENSMQAAAFMHQCMFSVRHKKFREPFRKFTTRLEAEPFTEELFHECFGLSTHDMDSYLQDYLFGVSIKYETSRYKVAPELAISLQPAKPGEVLRLFSQIRQIKPVK